MNGKNKRITEEIFNMAKIMTKGGATISQISNALGICKATVSYLRRANTYADYKEIVLSASSGHKNKLKREAEKKAKEEAERKAKEEAERKVEEAKREEVKPVPPPQDIEYRITLIANQYIAEQLKKQTELLTLINNKLTCIAEDLGCLEEKKASNG